MTGPVRVFVDGKPMEVAAGSTVATVLAADDADLGAALANGRAYVTDGVGRPVSTDLTVFPGAIYRVVRSARRGQPDA